MRGRGVGGKAGRQEGGVQLGDAPLNELLHHFHPRVELIQGKDVLLSKQPQPWALPEVLQRERKGEAGTPCGAGRGAARALLCPQPLVSKAMARHQPIRLPSMRFSLPETGLSHSCSHLLTAAVQASKGPDRQAFSGTCGEFPGTASAHPVEGQGAASPTDVLSVAQLGLRLCTPVRGLQASGWASRNPWGGCGLFLGSPLLLPGPLLSVSYDLRPLSTAKSGDSQPRP